MKTLERRARRAAAAGGLALAALATAGAQAAPALDLDRVMGQLAQVRSGEARFTEQRTVRGLDAPLTSSGTLSFAAPDRFTRQTLLPRPETMAVDGNTVVLSRGGRSRSLTLDAAPEVEAIVEAVRGTLTGNATRLRQHFRATVAGSVEQWTLDLVPIEPRLLVLLKQVTIVGRLGELRTVEMRMADGDRSMMVIEPLPAGAAGAAAPASR